MIAGIKGKIFDISPGEVFIDTGNGFIVRVLYPVSSYTRLKSEIDEILLYTVLRQREEESILYGFFSQREKLLFEKLISISGVGGKTALSFISAFSVRELIEAIDNGDVEKLVSIPGIGKKTAQRIVLELTGKLDLETEKIDDQRKQLKDDLISGLVNLGFHVKGVAQIVDRVIKENPEQKSFEAMLKNILRQIRKT